jgi:hypothetical protein
MNHRARPAAVPLIVLLVIALAAGILMGATLAKAGPPANQSQDHGGKPGGTVVWPPATDPANPSQDDAAKPGVPVVLPVPDFVTPDLGAVPDTVKVKSTKHPPQNVKFDGEPMPGGITTGTGTAAGGLGEVLVPGVPGYAWRDGCGPTAVGIVVGYYDGQGWPDLIPGDATGVTTDVNQAIATHGSAGAPGHYEDYALPTETGSGVLPDKSELPAGDEHVSNSVADFMHSSWSSEQLQYGWSWSDMVGPAFTGYAKLKYPDSVPTSSCFQGSRLTWTLVKQEIDAGRPMVFLVDSTGDGATDHFVTVVGYRETNGYPEYGCWDTWSTSVVRWQQFRAMSSSYAWGVWGGYTFSLSASPTPSPTPTPTPTITPTPTPAPVDVMAPETAQSGADDAWHSSSVTVILTATDNGSGVAYTEYQLDGGTWTRGTTVTVAAPRKTAAAVSHSLSYHSVDNAGNAETTKTCTVYIDTTKPVTSSSSNPSPGSVAVLLAATDTGSGVSSTYYAVDRGSFRTGTAVTVTGAGRHTVKFYSQDVAGNLEATKSVSVTVK